MTTAPNPLAFYAGMALVLGVLIGYLILTYMGKSGRWFMQDVGLYLLYIGASLLGVSLPIMFGTAGGTP